MRTCLVFSLVVGALASAIAGHAQVLPAFPGATGPGSYATGGRGGDVYHVTTLDADKNGAIPGSLQYGINTAPSAGRTIVFDVGGTIFHDGVSSGDRLRYGKSNITVAGQTAPGPGITIAGTGTKWTTDNLILRNLTVRPNRNSNGTTHDAFDLQVKNSILDHVSASWYTDEGISITDAGANSTVQYATMGEGLAYGGHSFGSIIATETDGTHYSFNHNLYAHNASRMPAIGSETGQTGAVLSFTNNVIYNWRRTKAGYSSTNQQSRSNFLANFYITGNDNGNLTFSGGDDDGSPGDTKIFLDKTDPVTANVGDMNKDGDLDDWVPFTKGDNVPGTGNTFYSGDFTVVGTAFAVNGVVTPEPAELALQRVVDYGGANWNNRNPIEQRIIGSVTNATGNLVSDLSSGQQATEWATVLSERPVGGVAPFSRGAGWDLDNDGMPGAWEEEHGLDPNVANHNADFDSDGYTDLEEYLNEIAAWPASAPIRFEGQNARYAEIQNWIVNTPQVTSPGAQNAFNDFHWQPSKYDTAVINQGTVEVDAVGQHAGNLVLGMNPGDDATLNITDGWIKVEDAAHGLSDGITVIGDDPDATAVLNLSGGRLQTKTLLKGAGGSMNFTGGVLSAETVGFDLVNLGGVIAPGASIGTTDILGDLIFDSGELEIELSSLTEADSLTVQGALTLGGALNVALLDGFSPTSGSWTIATAASFLGTFDSVTPGFAVATQGNDLVLSVAVDLPGDFDSNGVVDATDYAMWREGLGVDYTSEDFDVWIENFGGSAASLAQSSRQTVPEPTVLAILAPLVLIGFRRRAV